MDRIYTYHSGNRSLFIDTHTSPVDFYDGSFYASQLTFTLDASRNFNVGMATPLTVSAGFEGRQDTFRITQGDPTSYYKEGPQSFTGYSPATAINKSRKNYAGYVDFAIAPIEQLQIDLAGRAEHFSDFGDTQIGKLTARYDFIPQLAVRGTVSTGFRAPTLAWKNFIPAQTCRPSRPRCNCRPTPPPPRYWVSPTSRRKYSTSFSVGVVSHPIEDLSLTVDAYSIKIGNRIATSSTAWQQCRRRHQCAVGHHVRCWSTASRWTPRPPSRG